MQVAVENSAMTSISNEKNNNYNTPTSVVANVVDSTNNNNSNNTNNNQENNHGKVGDTKYVTIQEEEKMRMIPPRLIKRDLPLLQSRNRMKVKNLCLSKDVRRLLVNDWFHVLLRYPTRLSLVALLLIWTLFISIFAGFYVWNNKTSPTVCALGPAGAPISFQAAFAFSLQTCTTVGYTLPSGSNAFFENCPALQTIIFWQSVWSMFFNAFLFAFFYAQLAKSDSRGVQVIFSQKAIIGIQEVTNPFVLPSNNRSKAKQQVRFQVRIYDIDSQAPVVEAHVRMYVIMKDKPAPRPLRLLQPNDNIGGMLFLSVPSIVSHHIDTYSLLYPMKDPKEDRSRYFTTCERDIQSLIIPRYGLHLRQSDAKNGARDECTCPACGEAYGTVERLICHIRYNQVIEHGDEWPITRSSHLSIQLLDDDGNSINFDAKDQNLDHSTSGDIEGEEEYDIDNDGKDNNVDDNNIVSNNKIYPNKTIISSTLDKPTLNIELIRRHFQENVSEVIIVVEGIEPTVSGTFAAMQSYQFEDIEFDETAYFRPCIHDPSTATSTTDKLQVDLDCFHGVDYYHTTAESKNVYKKKTKENHKRRGSSTFMKLHPQQSLRRSDAFFGR